MDSIPVPAPPPSAYNPNRRVSDLILGQLKHFQHVEQKHGNLGIDPALARDIYTEAGAARYITAITRALRGRAAAQPVAATSPSTPPPPTNVAVLLMPKAVKQPSKVRLAIAASAAKPPAKKVAKKTAAKKPAQYSFKRKK
ncbi:hypothetical protein [Granulicella sp. S190]|uniref:hypothetical protein n=1 Tax=Granulicella sp. S190 TaxID=1747226 RepID=UPI00131B0E20|nr:hypothetical protein [Granulicella sp. S190]